MTTQQHQTAEKREKREQKRVPVMQLIETTIRAWGGGGPGGLQVPRVLHATGALDAPEQRACASHARRDCPVSRESWPGASAGVRAPFSWENPLSDSEVLHGIRAGVLQ